MDCKKAIISDRYIRVKQGTCKSFDYRCCKGWNEAPGPEEVALYGHGIVPIRIEDIVQTKDDEIKFLVTDVSEKWNTYNYYFPIPLKDNYYPYFTRATMCYFPICDRAQGLITQIQNLTFILAE